MLVGAPYDSDAINRANFESVQKDWGITRVFWRGGQDKYLHEYADFVKDETILHSLFWDWLFEHDEANSNAVKICKDLGLNVWLWTGLFEFGADKDTGGSVLLPFLWQHKLRTNNPEWLPVNKYGTRRQDGPIEFCYPEARAAFIQTLKTFLLQEGYEGIVFYTYVENFGTRYLDEFGFNQPIVDEFKKRYGVDIRTEPFDKQAWADLRGEYVTQFLRELKSELKPHNIKVGVEISSGEIENEDPIPNLPSPWPGIWSKADKHRIGRISMDWRAWVDEGLIDELSVARPGDENVAQELLDYCQAHNKNVQVSVWRQKYQTTPEGAIPLYPVLSSEYAFPKEQYQNPPNNFDNPAKTLAEGDKWEKRQVLHLAIINRITLDLESMAAATTDEDVYVRRMAISALGESGLPEAVPFIEAKLDDPENAVRCLAAVTLSSMAGPDSLKKILDAIVSHGNMQYNLFAVTPAVRQMKSKGTLGAAQKNMLRDYFTHTNPGVRQAVVYAVKGTGLAPEFKNELMNMASSDSDDFCKATAMRALPVFGIEAVFPVLKKNMEGTNEVMQVRAAEAFEMQAGIGLHPYEDKVLSLLLQQFKKYGSDSKRSDLEWGWRSVGNAIVAIGSAGEAALEELMRNPQTDEQLAELAWRVVYIPQQRRKYVNSSIEQDELAHRKHPTKQFFK